MNAYPPNFGGGGGWGTHAADTLVKLIAITVLSRCLGSWCQHTAKF